MPIYDASAKYMAAKTPLMVLAGKEYGTGSSRDWAAKGTYLLGVRAVIAESFERIHRSNLVGMGVLPLRVPGRPDRGIARAHRARAFEIRGIEGKVTPRSMLTVVATAEDGTVREFRARCRIDTPVEAEYFRHGGILEYVLRRLAGFA